MKEPRKILIPHGVSLKIGVAVGGKDHPVSQPTIRKALRYEENTGCAEEVSLARKIRYVAVKHFGGMDTGAADMEVENNIGIFRYANGAVLSLDFNTGEAKITKNGKDIDHADKIYTNEIIDWQIKAENLI